MVRALSSDVDALLDQFQRVRFEIKDSDRHSRLQFRKRPALSKTNFAQHSICASKPKRYYSSILRRHCRDLSREGVIPNHALVRPALMLFPDVDMLKVL
jgi:hypothetical protein